VVARRRDADRRDSTPIRLEADQATKWWVPAADLRPSVRPTRSMRFPLSIDAQHTVRMYTHIRTCVWLDYCSWTVGLS
jgi:hypothetical protein